MFNDLKFGKNEIELADVYFRFENKVIIGQAKSGNIYDEEKFSGALELLYKNNRDKFFKDFGVNQIITSIRNVNEYIIHLDSKFPKGQMYYLYPCIIVNDKALQTPFMADTFNKRFNELITSTSIDIKKIQIYPLTLIHISDLERIEDFINENPEKIWEIFEDNFKDKQFIPPFYSTINRNVKELSLPKRVTNLLKELIIKYNP
jgi:hypothetical protein